jgi:hypothetical protein
MGTREEHNRVEALRSVAQSLGVEATTDDLAATLGFLDRILPELERLEAALEPEDAA